MSLVFCFPAGSFRVVIASAGVFLFLPDAKAEIKKEPESWNGCSGGKGKRKTGQGGKMIYGQFGILCQCLCIYIGSKGKAGTGGFRGNIAVHAGLPQGLVAGR